MQEMLNLKKTLQMVPKAHRYAHHQIATRYIKNAIFHAQRGNTEAAQDYYAHAKFQANIAFAQGA
jgi:hypothetical protein